MVPRNRQRGSNIDVHFIADGSRHRPMRHTWHSQNGGKGTKLDLYRGRKLLKYIHIFNFNLLHTMFSRK